MRPDSAAIEDDDGRYIVSQLYLEKIEKNLNILADIKKENPRLYTLTEMNISERSEMEIRKCTDFDTFSAAKDPLPFLLDIIQKHQLAPTGDSVVDANVAMQFTILLNSYLVNLLTDIVLDWKLKLR